MNVLQSIWHMKINENLIWLKLYVISLRPKHRNANN